MAGVIAAIALTGLLVLAGLFFLARLMQREMRHYVESANDRFILEQQRSKSLLDQNKQTIEDQLGQLNKELDKMSKQVNDFEKDRQAKFSRLETRLDQAATATQGLEAMTRQLNSVLSNNQQRGMIAQHLADDILHAAGLEENLHYFKERTQNTVNTRPDYTFPLPNGKKIYMDVKFPLAHYLEMSQATDMELQNRHSLAFLRDVKERINELKKREYVNREEDTIDRVILFIPSEQIFSHILKTDPNIMAQSLEQKVVLTSPFTLYAVLAVVREMHELFNFQKSTEEIMKVIALFADDYDRFKVRFADLGESIDKVRSRYDEVNEKSFKRLDQRLKKIDDFRKGGQSHAEAAITARAVEEGMR